MPDLLQDADAGQLPKVGPGTRRSIPAFNRKGAQVKGPARYGEGSFDLRPNRIQYDTVDFPFTADFGPVDARWRDAIGRPLFSWTLRG